jgi:predicted Co/Zn/Cd cation transporter (cation efflux family)
LVAAGPTPAYPFGREALAPLVVAAQALVLAGTFGYAAVDAVGVILGGGSETEVGSALVYSVLSLLAAVVVRQVLVRWRAGSDLVAAEVDQWQAAVVLGVAMAIGFAAAVALEGSAWSHLAPFVDPVLVLVAAGLILPTPVRMLRQSFRELLEGCRIRRSPTRSMRRSAGSGPGSGFPSPRPGSASWGARCTWSWTSSSEMIRGGCSTTRTGCAGS